MPLNLPAPRASASSSEAASTTLKLPKPRTESLATPAVQTDNYADVRAVPSEDAAEGVTSTRTPSSFTSKLGLPPPKTKSKAASTSQPKKFVLDLPKPSGSGRTAAEVDNASDGQQTNGHEEGPVSKKPRIAGGSGLSSLLPDPKKPAGLGGLKLPDPKSSTATSTNGSTSITSSKPATSLLPHVLKGKQKSSNISGSATTHAVVSSVSSTSALAPNGTEGTEDQQEEEEEEETPADDAVLDFFGLGPATTADSDDDESAQSPAVDFFGLGGPSASISKSSTSTPSFASKKSVSSAPGPVASTSSALQQPTVKKVSAAPTTAAPDLASNYYATLPVPTKSDPYPGFFQKPDGTWAPRRPEEWEVWSQAQGWNEDAEAEAAKKKEKEYEMPADFSEEAAGQSVEIRAAALRGRPGTGLDEKPGRFSEEEQKRIEQEQNKAKAKKFSHNARARNQLTTLVANAQMNRNELEDRISQMKSNKRTGGQKYGF